MSAAEKSHRNTRQKAAILEVLRQSGGAHVTADDLMEQLKAHGEPVGRATVYRYLRQLESGGSIQKYELPDRSGSCYAYLEAGSPCHGHYHVKCRQCGAVLHVESDLPAQFSAMMRERYQFTIDEGKTVFYGTCEACRKESGE